MAHFNIASLIKIMQKALNESQIATAQFLFGVLENSEALNLKFSSTDKVISGLMSHQKEVPADVKEAAKKPEIIKEVQEYFSQVIVSKITPYLLNDACEELLVLLGLDSDVSEITVSEFEKIQQDQGQATFLADCFLYALSKPNKAEEILPGTEDFPLLDEVANECPICHTKLTKKVKGVIKKHYEIVPIFPESLSQTQASQFKAAWPPAKKLNSADNKIALCSDHAENYLTEPEVEEYIQLSELKASYAKNYEMKQALIQMDLEDEIASIIQALTMLTNDDQLEALNLTALAIKQKIYSEYFILKTNLQYHVLTYYRFISELFNQLEVYDFIASDIKKAYKKLEQSNLTQPEIIECLAEWIREKTKLSPASLPACRIVVSFFVQSCEVFHEISK